MSSTLRSSLSLMLVLMAAGCSRNLPAPSVPSEAVVRELDAMRDITKATHDEYERLASSVVFPDDTMKNAATEWRKKKDLEWLQVQFGDLRARKAGTIDRYLDFVVMIGTSDSYVEKEPAVFVKTTYSLNFKPEHKELASLAKCASLREEFDASKVRLFRALLEQEAASAKR